MLLFIITMCLHTSKAFYIITFKKCIILSKWDNESSLQKVKFYVNKGFKILRAIEV